MLNQCIVKTAFDFINLDEKWVQKNMAITGLKILRELKGEQCFLINEQPQRKKSICTSKELSQRIQVILILSKNQYQIMQPDVQKNLENKRVVLNMLVFF